MKHTRLAVLMAVMLLITAGAGCYTIVRHPGGASTQYTGGSADHYYDDPFLSQYGHWMDVYYYAPYYSGHVWDPWAGYPYWRDYYYHRPMPYYYRPVDPAPVHSGGRSAWDRGPGAPSPPSVGDGRVVPAPKNEPQPPAQPAPEPEKPERDRKPRTDEPRRSGWSR